MANGYKSTTGIREISDNTVFLRDKTMLAVFEISPLDFDRMGERGKQKAMKKYKEWIESLEYPVQIVARNVNMDVAERAKVLKGKIEQLIKQKVEYREMMKLFKEFEEWFDRYVSKNSRARRIFYLIVPFMGNYQPSITHKVMKKKAKQSYDKNLKMLNKRAEECVKLLEETGVKSHRLTSGQLDNLYCSYFMIHNQQGAAEKSVYISPEDWFRMWKDAVVQKKK